MKAKCFGKEIEIEFDKKKRNADLFTLKDKAITFAPKSEHEEIKQAYDNVQMLIFELEGVKVEKEKMKKALSIIREKGIDTEVITNSTDYENYVEMCEQEGWKQYATKEEYELLTYYF